jgi:hypothetical protein
MPAFEVVSSHALSRPWRCGRRQPRQPWLVAIAHLLLVAAAVPAAPTSTKEALILEHGAIARQQLVAVGRDLSVAGEALADVAVIEGNAFITGSIGGDLIVLGGDARLAATASITGDVFALGGRIRADPGATIGGRSVSYPTFSSAWLTLLEGPSVGLSPTSPLVLGGKLALLAAWAALLLAFFATGGSAVLSTSEAVRAEPLRSFVVGITAVLALVMTAMFFTALAAALVGLPLLALVVVLGLVLKFWGMVAVFHALGAALGRLLRRRRSLVPLHAACLGLAVLGVLKFVPFAGVLVWTAASLVGVGATLITKFGRREPWFATEQGLAEAR